MPKVLSAQDAEELILSGNAPVGMDIAGHLDFSNNTRLTVLPENLTVRRLTLDGCSALHELPRGLRCYELSAQATPLTRLPDDLQVTFRLDLSQCDMLESLPVGLKVGTLVVRGCTGLRDLPEGLDVWFLDMPGCVRLSEFPVYGPEQLGRLNMRGCTRLGYLPSWLKRVAQLDVSGCNLLTELPVDLHICSWVDLAGTGLQALPDISRHAGLRRRGVAINERIAFRPETITGHEILNEDNVEVRRVMMERLGYEAFFEQIEAQELDRDRDPGGERKLLWVSLPNEEPLVCLACQCPSTGRRYLLRVPPGTRSCHQAAAWIAGFDNPDDYRPLAET